MKAEYLLHAALQVCETSCYVCYFAALKDKIAPCMASRPAGPLLHKDIFLRCLHKLTPFHDCEQAIKVAYAECLNSCEMGLPVRLLRPAEIVVRLYNPDPVAFHTGKVPPMGFEYRFRTCDCAKHFRGRLQACKPLKTAQNHSLGSSDGLANYAQSTLYSPYDAYAKYSRREESKCVRHWHCKRS